MVSRVRRLLLRQRAPASFAAVMGREYDRQTEMVFRRVLSRDSICLDVGANVGLILGMMRRYAPAGRHHAFEALPHLADDLRKRYAGVVVHNVAVADTTGSATFNFVENGPSWSGLKRNSYDFPDPQIRELTVSLARIDDLVPSDVIVRLIKIDVEGAEYHALLGAENVIRRSRPFVIMEACRTSTGNYGVTAEQMFDLVTQRFGLRLTTMYRWLTGNPAYDLQGFVNNWEHGPDFYFLAHPET